LGRSPLHRHLPLQHPTHLDTTVLYSTPCPLWYCALV
jgi:hypothetical protein